MTTYTFGRQKLIKLLYLAFILGKNDGYERDFKQFLEENLLPDEEIK